MGVGLVTWIFRMVEIGRKLLGFFRMVEIVRQATWISDGGDRTQVSDGGDREESYADFG